MRGPAGGDFESPEPASSSQRGLRRAPLGATVGATVGAPPGTPLWLAWGPVAVALALLLVVEGASLDERLFLWFNALPARTGPALWAHITILGDGLVCAVLLLPWIRRHPDRVWGGLLGAVLMVVILRLFKGLLSLPRPLGLLPEDLVHVIGPGHRRSAFPSGHAATFAVFAGVWALSTTRRWLSGLALGAAALVGISRMAVGVHWPTDVLGGFALGWFSAWMGLRWAHRAPWGLRQPGRNILAGALVVAATVLLVIDHTGYPGVLIFQRLLAGGCLAWGLLAIGRMKKDGSLHDGNRGVELNGEVGPTEAGP